jgi:hypothetical protein
VKVDVDRLWRDIEIVTLTMLRWMKDLKFDAGCAGESDSVSTMHACLR